MARIFVPTESVTIEDSAAIATFLQPHGIWYERWDVENRLPPNATDEQILSIYAPEIDRLKERGGYVTADVINVSPSTPNLDAMLDKFNKEHTHSEDEVRFVVAGSGIFHINPVASPVFSVEMFAGDLINVPAGTRHWFNLCAERSIKTIRLFLDSSGWAPSYIESPVHADYEPLCFGPSYIQGQSGGAKLSSPIKP